MKIIKKYNGKYNDIKYLTYHNGNYLYSNDNNVLKEIKIRLKGLNNAYNHHGDYALTYIENNKECYFINNFDELLNINWFNNYEILNYLSEKDFTIIKIHEAIETDLDRENFINKYLTLIDEGKYKSNIILRLFEDEEKNERRNNKIVISNKIWIIG